jgi:hypothetical protein
MTQVSASQPTKSNDPESYLCDLMRLKLNNLENAVRVSQDFIKHLPPLDLQLTQRLVSHVVAEIQWEHKCLFLRERKFSDISNEQLLNLKKMFFNSIAPLISKDLQVLKLYDDLDKEAYDNLFAHLLNSIPSKGRIEGEVANICRRTSITNGTLTYKFLLGEYVKIKTLLSACEKFDRELDRQSLALQLIEAIFSEEANIEKPRARKEELLKLAALFVGDENAAQLYERLEKEHFLRPFLEKPPASGLIEEIISGIIKGPERGERQRLKVEQLITVYKHFDMKIDHENLTRQLILASFGSPENSGQFREIAALFFDDKNEFQTLYSKLQDAWNGDYLTLMNPHKTLKEAINELVQTTFQEKLSQARGVLVDVVTTPKEPLQNQLLDILSEIEKSCKRDQNQLKEQLLQRVLLQEIPQPFFDKYFEQYISSFIFQMITEHATELLRQTYKQPTKQNFFLNLIGLIYQESEAFPKSIGPIECIIDLAFNLARSEMDSKEQECYLNIARVYMQILAANQK